MNKMKYYIIGIFIIVMLSVVYISHINREAKEKSETDLNFRYEKIIENYTDKGNQTPIKIRGRTVTGEEPIEINSSGNWFVRVVFDSQTTEKKAKERISRYNIPKPRSIKSVFSYPQYYVSVSKGDFEVIKNRLAEEESVRLSEKLKITGGNFTAGIWVMSDNNVLFRLKSSDIPFKKTMAVELLYGPETPQTESKHIMQQLDSDEKIINTNVGYLFGEERS
ncbi:Uncharacterised protein [uncultured archaeon]|nr:Uncharacterised protein [uncultured archaeon]